MQNPFPLTPGLETPSLSEPPFSSLVKPLKKAHAEQTHLELEIPQRDQRIRVRIRTKRPLGIVIAQQTDRKRSAILCCCCWYSTHRRCKEASPSAALSLPINTFLKQLHSYCFTTGCWRKLSTAGWLDKLKVRIQFMQFIAYPEIIKTKPRSFITICFLSVSFRSSGGRR